MMGYFEDCKRRVGEGSGHWHSLAAAQGHGQAQLSLALHLLRGSGGLRADGEEAVKWLEVAAAQGVEEAAHSVRELCEGGNVRASSSSLSTSSPYSAGTCCGCKA